MRTFEASRSAGFVQARLMWAMGARIQDGGVSMRTLPSAFGVLSRRFGTPVRALLVQFLLASVMCRFDFAALVQFEMFLNCVCLGLEFAAFLVLRYTEPLTPRPYVVPGGLWGAWGITLSKSAILLFTVGSIIWLKPVIFAGAVLFNALVVAVYYWQRFRKRRRRKRHQRQRSLSHFGG